MFTGELGHTGKCGEMPLMASCHTPWAPAVAVHPGESPPPDGLRASPWPSLIWAGSVHVPEAGIDFWGALSDRVISHKNVRGVCSIIRLWQLRVLEFSSYVVAGLWSLLLENVY